MEQVTQQTQNISIASVQRRPNVFNVGLALYKCYTNILYLLGRAYVRKHYYKRVGRGRYFKRMDSHPAKIFKSRGWRFFHDLISMGNILNDVRSTKDTIMWPLYAWDHLGVVAYCWIVVSMVYSCQTRIALTLNE